jgi:hypothetical protein
MSFLIDVLGYLSIALVLYFFYTRVVFMYYSKWYYTSQGVHYSKGSIPVLGHMFRFGGLLDKYGPVEAPPELLFKEDYEPDKIPGLLIL